MPDTAGQKRASIFTDGGSRGNPGPGAGAYLLKNPDGSILEGKGVFLSDTTSNAAEYTGFLEGLRAAVRRGIEAIEIFCDSELLVRQINGQYKVKSESLRPLYAECMDLLGQFASWKVWHIRREKNIEADALANQAMDRGHEVQRHEPLDLSGVKPLRLGVLLSGGGRTMANLQEEIAGGRLPAEIVLVISSRGEVQGVERARQIGLDPVILRKKDYPDIEDFSNRIAAALDRAKVDLVVQAGWLCLWRIPRKYAHRVMNIHPALLPSFGGRGMWGHHVHEAVLKAGCRVSGCTVHFCTNEYDAGPIIVQRCCPVKEDDDADTLAARVFKEECIAYPEAIRLFAAGKLAVKSGRVKRG